MGVFAADFDKEYHGEGKQYDEVGILDAAGGLLILFHGYAQVDVDGAWIVEGIVAAEDLREVAVEPQDFPVCRETLVANLSVGRQIVSAEEQSALWACRTIRLARRL